MGILKETALVGLEIEGGMVRLSSQLSVRDYFAAAALPAVIALTGVDGQTDLDVSVAYDYADAMLQASAATQETATVQCISGDDTLTEREVPIAAPSFVWGPESQSYTGGPIYRVGTSSGAVTAALQDKYEDFHPKELDAPTDEQGQYFCNKCGYFGQRGPRHCRPTTNEECGYSATFRAPAKAARLSDVPESKQGG